MNSHLFIAERYKDVLGQTTFRADIAFKPVAKRIQLFDLEMHSNSSFPLLLSCSKTEVFCSNVLNPKSTNLLGSIEFTPDTKLQVELQRLAWFPTDAGAFLVGLSGQGIAMVDTESFQTACYLKVYPKRFHFIEFAPRKPLFAVGSSSWGTRLVDLRTMDTSIVLHSGGPAECVDGHWLSDNLFFHTTRQRSFELWDIRKHEPLSSGRLEDAVLKTCIGEDGVFGINNQGNLDLYDVYETKKLSDEPIDVGLLPLMLYKNNDSLIYTTKARNDLVVSKSLHTGLICRQPAHMLPIVASAHTDGILFTGQFNGVVARWDMISLQHQSRGITTLTKVDASRSNAAHVFADERGFTAD
ncbi:hypothetical protein PCE1_000549 [Barthelona sp. PCE]